MARFRIALVIALLMFASLFPAATLAQNNGASPQAVTAFAVLTKTVESKTAVAGQELTFRTLRDVKVNDVVIIPAGTELVGRVADVGAKAEGGGRTLSVVVLSALMKDGGTMPLKAIIAAVAAPHKDALAEDPVYGMMHSKEPTMTGATAGGAVSSGTLSQSSKASSTAAVATADIEGRRAAPLSLAEDSQGAIGYDGLSITWELRIPPPLTIFATKSKNIKLEAGTQLLLRMAPPRAPK